MFTVTKNNSHLSNNLLFLTGECLSNDQISNDNMIKIINNLDSSKAHGHDMISIRTLNYPAFLYVNTNYF